MGFFWDSVNTDSIDFTTGADAAENLALCTDTASAANAY